MKKKAKYKRISYLEKRKNYRDKWEDIIDIYKGAGFVIKKNGENSFSREKYYKKIAKGTGFSIGQVKKFFAGRFTKKEEGKINKLHKGFDKIKKVSKPFTKHNFTFKNFFHPKVDRLKKNEQYYFRAGLEIYYVSKNSGKYIEFEGVLYQVWIMPDVHISHFDFKGYPEGYRTFFNKIKYRIHQHDSFLFFVFKYLDINLVDMSNYNKIKRSWK